MSSSTRIDGRLTITPWARGHVPAQSIRFLGRSGSFEMGTLEATTPGSLRFEDGNRTVGKGVARRAQRRTREACLLLATIPRLVSFGVYQVAEPAGWTEGTLRQNEDTGTYDESCAARVDWDRSDVRMDSSEHPAPIRVMAIGHVLEPAAHPHQSNHETNEAGGPCGSQSGRAISGGVRATLCRLVMK